MADPASTANQSSEPGKTNQPAKRRVTVDQAIAQLAGPERKTFATVFTHGSLEVEIYSPQKIDPQQPHTRDEVYVVVQGTGEYISAAGRQPFEQGDFLFAPAGEVHRFENFTDDSIFWVLFYGPEGGEASLKAKP
jgi:mannose-6-phosphate isomerase-like protein (cupin superfamily)